MDAHWQVVELFSGVGNVPRAFREAGYTACNFDKLSGGEIDFSTPSGFAFGAQYIFGTLKENIFFRSFPRLAIWMCLGFPEISILLKICMEKICHCPSFKTLHHIIAVPPGAG